MRKIKDPNRVAAGKRSRSKGGRIERELVAWMKELGITSAERTAQRSGKGGPSDLKAPDQLPSFLIESKGTASPHLECSKLHAWFKKLEVDCEGTKLVPVLFTKANHGSWIGIVSSKVYLLLRLDKHLIPCVEESFNANKILDQVYLTHRMFDSVVGKINRPFPSIGFEVREDLHVFAVYGFELLAAMLEYEDKFKQKQTCIVPKPELDIAPAGDLVALDQCNSTEQSCPCERNVS